MLSVDAPRPGADCQGIAVVGAGRGFQCKLFLFPLHKNQVGGRWGASPPPNRWQVVGSLLGSPRLARRGAQNLGLRRRRRPPLGGPIGPTAPIGAPGFGPPAAGLDGAFQIRPRVSGATTAGGPDGTTRAERDHQARRQDQATEGATGRAAFAPRPTRGKCKGERRAAPGPPRPKPARRAAASAARHSPAAPVRRGLGGSDDSQQLTVWTAEPSVS